MSMTRGMLVTALYRYSHATETENATFTDVSTSDYYSVPIAWAANVGVVNGVGNNQFAPNRAITREEFATIMARYINKFNIELENVNSRTLNYSDVNQIADYAVENVQLLQE